LLCDHHPLEPPWLPPEDERDAQAAAASGDAMPGLVGWQFWRGISAKAPPPTAIVPITRSATWPERFTGGDATGGIAGLRFPNSLSASLGGGLAMLAGRRQ
jgi:hypothetical protein